METPDWAKVVKVPKVEATFPKGAGKGKKGSKNKKGQAHELAEGDEKNYESWTDDWWDYPTGWEQEEPKDAAGSFPDPS